MNSSTQFLTSRSSSTAARRTQWGVLHTDEPVLIFFHPPQKCLGFPNIIMGAPLPPRCTARPRSLRDPPSPGLAPRTPLNPAITFTHPKTGALALICVPLWIGFCAVFFVCYTSASPLNKEPLGQACSQFQLRQFYTRTLMSLCFFALVPGGQLKLLSLIYLVLTLYMVAGAWKNGHIQSTLHAPRFLPQVPALALRLTARKRPTRPITPQTRSSTPPTTTAG